MATPPWLRNITNFVQDNSTSILTGVAVAGVVGTVALAIRATPTALEDLAAAREDKQMNIPLEVEYKVKLTPAEIFRVTWKTYLPAALSGAATIACIIGANAVGLRRNAALAASYTLVDSAFREYRDKVVEMFGDKEETKVTEQIAEDRIRAATTSNEVFIVGSGEVLCYDMLTGRLFKSDAESIRRAANDVDAQVLDDHYASVNDFYRFVGLDPVLVGDELGWNVDHRPKLKLSAHKTDCDQPALAIGWERFPISEYNRF
jgi:hypothetical protein